MTEFDRVHNPALQQERTTLAWDRTGLALMVASGLLLRAAGPPYPRLLHVVPAVAFLVGLSLLFLGRRRYLRRWRGLESGLPILSPAPVAMVGVVTVVLGITGFAVALL